MTRLSRPQRLLLQLAVLATLLMVLAPLVSRALQAQPMEHAAMAGMDHAAMGHDMHDMAMAGHDQHGVAPAAPSRPPDPHAVHGEACEYCVLAMRLLPWLAVFGAALYGATGAAAGSMNSEFAGIFAVDAFTSFFRVLFAVTLVVVIVGSHEYVSKNIRHQGEFYSMLLCRK